LATPFKSKVARLISHEILVDWALMIAAHGELKRKHSMAYLFLSHGQTGGWTRRCAIGDDDRVDFLFSSTSSVQISSQI
jgi:hypothetical protein